MQERTAPDIELSPLWCHNDLPHTSHRERNAFNGWNECTGRPEAELAPELVQDLKASAQDFRDQGTSAQERSVITEWWASLGFSGEYVFAIAARESR